MKVFDRLLRFALAPIERARRARWWSESGVYYVADAVAPTKMLGSEDLMRAELLVLDLPLTADERIETLNQIADAAAMFSTGLGEAVRNYRAAYFRGSQG